jgi:hypothetical protein
MRIASIFLSLGAFAGAAQAAPSLPDKLLAGRTAGPPVHCIDRNRVFDTQTYDDGSIFYRMGAKNDYLQRPRNCSQLNSNRSYTVVSTTSQLCEGDIMNVFDPTTRSPYGACIFDDFVPYSKKHAQ